MNAFRRFAPALRQALLAAEQLARAQGLPVEVQHLARALETPEAPEPPRPGEGPPGQEARVRVRYSPLLCRLLDQVVTDHPEGVVGTEAVLERLASTSPRP